MKKGFKNILLFVGALMMLSPHVCLAQSLKFDFDEYTVSRGLSHNEILCIAQDSIGFMWFGTQDGLNRFDGYTFKKYKNFEADSLSIISNEVRALLADDDGSLWIGTNNGVCRYFPDRELMKRYEINYTDPKKLHGNYVSSIKKNIDGSVWITYMGSGVDIIYPATDFVLHYTMYRDDNFILQNDMITSLQFMPDGNTLLGGKNGLQVISNDKRVLTEKEILIKYPWKKRVPNSYTNMVMTGNGTVLWISTELDGLFKIDLLTNAVQGFHTTNSALESNSVYCIYEDSKHNIWIGGDALYYYENNSNQILMYSKRGMYIKNSTNIIFEDNEKNLWIGTTRVGIRKINHDESDVTHFHSNQGEGSIKSDEVLCFNQDNTGNIWFSAGSVGLYKININNKDVSFTEDEVNAKLLGKSVKKIFKDKDGYFWLGSWEGGLNKFHPIKKTLKVFHPKKENFSSQHVWDIVDDDEGNLWLGTLRDGLCYFSPKTERYQYFKHEDKDTTSLVNNDVLSLLRDSRNILWVGTGNGLSVLFPKAKLFRNLFQIGSKANAQLTSNVILCMLEDSYGNIWLGTKGAGVIILKVQGENLSIDGILSEEDGLPSNIVNSMQEDKTGAIWIATNNGLSKIKSKERTVIPLNASLALRGIEFLTKANYISNDGRLIFGSSTGFYLIDPSNFYVNTKEPSVQLTGLKLQNNTIKLNGEDNILKKPLYLTKELTIPSEINYYSFEFVALNFTLTEKNQYAYKLEGFDKDWNYVGEQRFASYTNLDPGTYTLRVMASNNDNVWNKQGVTLVIHILPPWWKTWWFKTLLLGFIITLIIFIYQMRVRSIHAFYSQLEQQVAQRTAELSKSNQELSYSREEIAAQNEELIETQEEISAQRDYLDVQNRELETSYEKLHAQNDQLEKLHREKDGMIHIIAHDLKSPLKQIEGLVSLIGMTGEINTEQSKYITLISKVVNNGSNMINDLIEIHGIENIKDSQISEIILLDEFLPTWLENHNNLLTKKNQEVQVQIMSPTSAIKGSREMLSRILDNLLTNAMKFSDQDTSIYLTVWSDNNVVNISIKDEGPGISELDQKNLFIPFKKLSARPTGGESSSGLGLSIVKLLVEKMNGRVDINRELKKGTEFIITLPSAEAEV